MCICDSHFGLKHAGCLASLQHCLVHWVSPFGDLTLSPGGLRMLAWARYFCWHFSSSIFSILAVVLSVFWRTAQHWERDAVLFGSSLDWGFVEDLSRGIEQEINSCILEEFGRVLGWVFGGFYSVVAQISEELRRTLRGWFLRVSHSRKAFWVFLGFLSRARFQSFSFFWGGEQSQILVWFLAAAAAQQFSQLLGHRSKRGHSFAIVSVFLHLPCASRGAIFLITSCTHFIT